MAVTYKKLWKLLIDKNMKRTELRKAAGITTKHKRASNGIYHVYRYVTA